MDDIKSEFDFYKFKSWVKPEKIYWKDLVSYKNLIPFIEKNINLLCDESLKKLSRNPFAIELLIKNKDKISWNDFVNNPNAIHVIEDNFDLCIKSINWRGKIDLLRHPNFIHILKKYNNKIVDDLLFADCLSILAKNTNPEYINLLEKYMKKCPELVKNNKYYLWIDICDNPNAIHIIEQYLDKLPQNCWAVLANNPAAIQLLENNLDKLDETGWRNLSKNPNAIHILEKNIDKINWFSLSNNLNGGKILEKYTQNIKFYSFFDYDNLSVNSYILEIDYEAIQKRCNIYKEELISIALHPYRIEEYLKQGISREDLDKYI